MYAKIIDTNEIVPFGDNRISFTDRLIHPIAAERPNVGRWTIVYGYYSINGREIIMSHDYHRTYYTKAAGLDFAPAQPMDEDIMDWEEGVDAVRDEYSLDVVRFRSTTTANEAFDPFEAEEPTETTLFQKGEPVVIEQADNNETLEIFGRFPVYGTISNKDTGSTLQVKLNVPITSSSVVGTITHWWVRRDVVKRAGKLPKMKTINVDEFLELLHSDKPDEHILLDLEDYLTN